MASRAGQQEVLIESDFLFGLRKSDLRHPKVLRALKLHTEDTLSIKVLSSAVLEVRAVLYSRGLGYEDIEDAFSLMGAMLADHGVREFVPLELSDVVVAERMRSQDAKLGFFDSLHAAVSRRLKVELLSSEGMYSRLGLPVLDLDGF